MKRLHIHIAVDDLDRSIGFYSTLFGAQPSVTKSGDLLTFGEATSYGEDEAVVVTPKAEACCAPGCCA
jgi:catechol 2,3-dioxygenase-like lactoylglutathione lyase family enzyme